MTVAETTTKDSAKLVAEHVGIEYLIRRSGECFRAVDDITLRIQPSEFVCIVGPSGCGKSTFLNAVAGLIPYSDGRLILDGHPIKGPGRDRSVVFQSAALLPWKNVVSNVAYGLELRGTKNKVAREKAQAMVTLVGLAGNEHRYPHELSGGMQQRVNLARALAADPELLLLDEPFAALDAQTREYMQVELLRIWQESRKTALFITHQIDEAIFLADRVVVLSKGPASAVSAIVEVGFPRPRNEDIKSEPAFIQQVNEIWHLIKSDKSSRKTKVT